MSLIQIVSALVEERGTATADQILPDCDGFTRTQVINALQNAAHLGLIRCAKRLGPSAGRSTRLGIYEPIERSYGRPVSSVWELGARA